MSATISRSDRIRVCIMVAVAGLSLAARLLAQQAEPALARGAYVRLTDGAQGRRIQGIFVQDMQDSLYIAVPGAVHRDTVAVSRAAVTALQVRRRAGTHMALGAGIGMLAGALLGGAAVMSDGSCWGCPSDGAMLASGVIGGAFVGTVIGVLFPKHRWEDVPPAAKTVPVALMVAPAGYGAGVRIGLPALR